MPDRTPQRLTVTSDTFQSGATIPPQALFNGFGVGGGNRSPQLRWSGAPQATKSYAVILHDPDAPTGTGFFHWVVFNIPPDVTELAENAGAAGDASLPRYAQHGHTDFGAANYGGPAPPPGHGPHHYHIHVYALDVARLDADEKTTAALLRFMMIGHIVAEGELVGIYER